MKKRHVALEGENLNSLPAFMKTFAAFPLLILTLAALKIIYAEGRP